MKRLNLTIAAVLVLGLVVVSTSIVIVGAEQKQNSISAIGVSNAGNGLQLSISTPVYNIGEIRWIVNGKRKKVEERHRYQESNYVGVQGIFYPHFLAWEGSFGQLKIGAGLRGFGSSSLKEEWSAGNYFREVNRNGGVYLLYSVQVIKSLNLARGAEDFESGTSTKFAPFWNLLDSWYFVATYQGGAGWENDSPQYPLWTNRGSFGLQYRF